MVWIPVPPKNSHIGILTLKDDGIKKLGLWDVFRSWGSNPHEWD